jgi:hypothetical protein
MFSVNDTIFNLYLDFSDSLKVKSAMSTVCENGRLLDFLYL